MVSFSSVFFIFALLPVYLVVYYVFKKEYRKYVILFESILFYILCEKERSLFLFVLVIIIYILGIFLNDMKEKGRHRIARSTLIFGIFTILIPLCWMKYRYFGQSISTNTLCGMSFYSFALISYIADIYTAKTEPQRDPVIFANYVLMFPKIMMGPIVRYRDIKNDLSNNMFSIFDISAGWELFLTGLFKKVLLADNLSLASVRVASIGDYSKSSVSFLWLASICYSLQLYFDFSGYSDMAIGIAQMFGFHLEKNFDYPYICCSIKDFWSRWHISLSTWFRDYIYIPLGGSRCSWKRHIVNLFIVWICTGLWHGANYTFLIWGINYGIILVIERYFIKPEIRSAAGKILWRIVTLIFININWVFFSSSSIVAGNRFILGMFGILNNNFYGNDTVEVIREMGFFIVLGIFFATPIINVLNKKIKELIINQKAVYLFKAISYLLLFVLALSYIVVGTYNPFMYQEF